jgi:hypothetical protein
MDSLCPSDEHLTALKNQVVQEGGEIDARVAIIQNEDPSKGAGIFSDGDIKRGDTLINIPFHLCISVERVAASSLKVVCDENPGLLQYPDEVMALGLMHGLDNSECPWHSHILTMPASFNTPLYWPEEDVEMLKGSIVYHLSLMMRRRMTADYNSLHAPLIEQYPELFPSASLDKYIWAMSVIYSRAIGVHRCGVYTRCIPPLMDMANHNPAECGPGIEPLAYSEAGDFLYLISSTNVSKGNEIFVRYQAYPNSKLLYSYGFVLSDCPDRAIDLWPRVPASSYRAADKEALLKSYKLTEEQTYDFKGTIRDNYVSPALLATCRVIKTVEDEWGDIENAFKGEIISVKNEFATYESLHGLVVGRMQADRAQEERQELGEMRLSPSLDRSDHRFMVLTMRVEERELLQVGLACCWFIYLDTHFYLVHLLVRCF